MKIAVITGATSGMGKEFVLQLEQFFNVDEVWVIARRENLLLELQNNLNTKVKTICLDLSKQESFETYKILLEDAKPEIMLLVNAAGVGRFGDFDSYPLEDDLKTIDLNVKATVSMCRLSIPYMVKGSKIVNLDSMSAFQPVPYMNTYASTKAFILSYTRGLNVELRKRFGIHAMAVSPLWVKSEFFSHAFENNNRVQNFNYFYESKDVVKKAYKDLLKGKKDLSIYGKYPRFQAFMVKILPTKWVINTWIKQQSKPKNNENLKK